MASGVEGRVKGAEGKALFLCERNTNFEITSVWAGIVGQDGIEPDTEYLLIAGEPVRVVDR